jgi:hypothetical protein
MDNLSDVMKKRLEKWRKNTVPVPSIVNLGLKYGYKDSPAHRRSCKNDYGDAMNLKEWDEEINRSQHRK